MTFRRFFGACALALALFLGLNGQAQSQQGQQQQPTLKPKLALSEVAFSLQLLDNVDIRGNEVDAFVETRKPFVAVIEAAQKDKKTAADVVVVEMNLNQAQNFLTLIQRASLKGGDADRFKKVSETIVESAPKPSGK